MKILYFSPHPNLNLASPAGYGTHMRGTIDAMKDLGHEVEIYIAGGANSEKVCAKKRKRFIWIKNFIPTWIKESWKDYHLLRINKEQKKVLGKLIVKYNPDLIYERSAYLMDSGVVVAKQFGVNHYLEVNAPFIQEKREMEGYSLFLSKAVEVEKTKALNTNKLIVVSSMLKEHMISKYHAEKEHVFVCPNGINLVDWQVDKISVAQKKDELNIKTSDFIVGFVGSILPHHGVEDLITAFHQVAQPNWKLLIVGDGWPMDDLKKQVNNLGIKGQVLFTGNVPFLEVKNYMALFSVGVMPRSNWYGSPVKIFEYGIMGLPVIAPYNGPINDVMKNEVTGYLINPENALEDLLLKVCKHPVKAKLIAEKWKSEVINKYTWLNLTKQVLSISQDRF